MPTLTCMQNLEPTSSSMMSMRKAPILLLTRSSRVSIFPFHTIRSILRIYHTIFLAGGKAVAAIYSVEDGDKIVQVALEKFGAVHVLVANAGIIRDKSFLAMTEQDWDLVLAVHLRYTQSYSLCLKHLLTIV